MTRIHSNIFFHHKCELTLYSSLLGKNKLLSEVILPLSGKDRQTANHLETLSVSLEYSGCLCRINRVRRLCEYVVMTRWQLPSIWVTVSATRGVPFIALPPIEPEITEFGQDESLDLVKSDCFFLLSILYVLIGRLCDLADRKIWLFFSFPQHTSFTVMNLNHFRTKTGPINQKCYTKIKSGGDKTWKTWLESVPTNSL